MGAQHRRDACTVYDHAGRQWWLPAQPEHDNGVAVDIIAIFEQPDPVVEGVQGQLDGDQEKALAPDDETTKKSEEQLPPKFRFSSRGQYRSQTPVC
jgi:hypothetical protein